MDKFVFTSNLGIRFGRCAQRPAGIALVPAGFGSLRGALLIENFSDGTINIFSPNGAASANFEGPLISYGG